MTIWSRWRSWIRHTLSRSRSESEMAAELRFHLDSYTEELVRQGVPLSEARRRARIDFGGMENAKEECREARGAQLLPTFLQDVRFGVRMLGKNPGFASVAILTLALGIGANTAIFSLINGIMLSSIPVRDPEPLVSLSWFANASPNGGYSSFGDCEEQGESTRKRGCSFSYPMFRELREKVDSYSGLAAFAGPDQLTLGGNGVPTIAGAEFVSGDYFQTLGVESALGRTLEPADEKPGAEPVAVLSYGYWQSTFGGAPSAVGKVIRLNGVSVTVVGVANRNFTRLSPGTTQDLWLSLAQTTRLKVPWAQDAEDPASLWLTIVARLRPGASAAQAQATTSSLFRNAMLYGSKPLLKVADSPGVTVVPAQEGLTGFRRDLGTPLYLLMAAVGVVLLIACANVAGLLVSRAAAREREIAVRLALGAGRARLVRQLLTESLLLSGAGAALGITLATWVVRTLTVFLLAAIPSPEAIDVHLDLRVLAFTVVVAASTGMLFGLVPALRGTRIAVAPALKQGAGSLLRGSSGWRTGALRLGNTLVVGQVALSVLVLVFAGLFLRTLTKLKGVDPGFDTSNLLTFGIDPTRCDYDAPHIQRLYEEFQRRLASIPGVLSASYSSGVLVSGSLWTGDVRLVGAKDKSSIHTQLLAVGPQFFETLRIPVVTGRGFASAEFASNASVALVNQAFVRSYLNGGAGLGQSLMEGDDKKPNTYEIQGVVADTKYYRLRQGEEPTVYLPLKKQAAFFSLRTAQDPTATIATVRRVASEIDSSVPLFAIRTQQEAIDQTLLAERLVARLSSVFGLLAIVLSTVGLFGLLSHEVSRRTRELGIRSALGAQRQDVVRLVVIQGFGLTTGGGAIGIALALGLTRYLRSLLFGIEPSDPVTLVAVVFVLLVVAGFACAIPARRATRVDPIVALRCE